VINGQMTFNVGLFDSSNSILMFIQTIFYGPRKTFPSYDSSRLIRTALDRQTSATLAYGVDPSRNAG
jgi:hypothetical protein